MHAQLLGPRALSLYLRAGLRPSWPSLQLRGRLGPGCESPGGDVEVIDAQAGDGELIAWDRDHRRAPAPSGPRLLGRTARGVPLWFVRHRQRVGYGYAQTHSDDLPAAPETVTLGSIGAREADDAAACAAAAVRWASGRAAAVRVSVPGPHPSLGPLLAHGLQIHDLDLFCSTPGLRFVDVRRYLLRAAICSEPSLHGRPGQAVTCQLLPASG